MCGVVGVWQPGDPNLDRHLSAMNEVLTPRGPDDQATWISTRDGIGLGHRRLSILDLSPHGRQPMVSHCGRYVIAYNGEVYNFEELRTRLGPRPWQSRTDTEVVLECIAAWGLSKALREFNGMFAFALWDSEARTLTLARDRFGIKPLCYSNSNDALLFGSTFAALRVHPGFCHEIDVNALAAYLRFGYVPAPLSIFSGGQKVAPGSWVRFDGPGTAGRVTQWWNAREERARAVAARGDPRDIVEDAVRAAVKARLVADVPVGAFLSGGIDSSLVVALMQQEASGAVKTFSIGSDSADYDEGAAAARVAEYLGTEHIGLTASSDVARDLIPRLPEVYDEPFADSSQLPTLMVSELARRSVTVALSGDGGDEAFGGYNRHVWAERIWRRVSFVPYPARAFAASALTFVSPQTWERQYERFRRWLPDTRLPTQKLDKVARLLRARDPRELYDAIRLQWNHDVVRASTTPPTTAWDETTSLTEEIMFQDLVGYLPDDILTKVDRATMAHSLEARVPLLDPSVVQAAWSIPMSAKVNQATGKKVLREVLARHVPPELWDRPKAGFGVPIEDWLRGPLRGWAEDQLSATTLDREGFFRSDVVGAAWRRFLDGSANEHHGIWSVLTFQTWLHSRGSVV